MRWALARGDVTLDKMFFLSIHREEGRRSHRILNSMIPESTSRYINFLRRSTIGADVWEFVDLLYPSSQAFFQVGILGQAFFRIGFNTIFHEFLSGY